MSRVSYFSLRTHTGTGVSHSQHRKKQQQQTKNSEEVWKKFRWMDQKEKKLAKKDSLAVGVEWIYTVLLQALKGESLSSGFSSTDGNLISASVAPHCGDSPTVPITWHACKYI